LSHHRSTHWTFGSLSDQSFSFKALTFSRRAFRLLLMMGIAYCAYSSVGLGPKSDIAMSDAVLI